MAERMGFQGKLREVLGFAREREDHLLAEDVEKFFEEEGLSPEQMELVFQYLTEQGIEVKGYAPSKGTAREAGEEEADLSPEEERYLETYRQEIEALEEAGDKTLARRLTEVVEEAVKLQRGEVFLGDLIQEGNMRLVMLLEEDPEKEEEARRVTVRSAMEEFIASSGEVRRRDRQMVRKVTDLNNTVKAMEEEEGRKVTLDEAAGRLGITRQEAEQIWKLTSEEEA
ncbi:MAG: RNA polymerase sigma factor region1.1 domain-containing protein [Massilistercora timonensis]|uniref:RNA polymerase sigma factor region1.1 domain-containing protein n=1 Tax=Massilistercora timonensis TaxID=2086584 RepID=UPI002FA65785